MPHQYIDGDDGHELDEAVYLLSGAQVCYHCGSQWTGLRWIACNPSDWRQTLDPESWAASEHQRAQQHDRFDEVTARVEKERANVGTLPSFWQNPSL